jgi:2,4-dienoyl-CoA reductase (NADPH2)
MSLKLAGYQKYPTLLSRLDLGHVVLRNRVVMGSMHTGLEEDDDLSRLAEFFAERARGGTGLIVTGGIPVNADSFGGLSRPFDNEANAIRWKVVTEAVHRHGAKICAQLLHTGRDSPTDRAVAPSAVKSPIRRAVPRELSSEEIERTIDDFAAAARYALQAGFDGVEVMGSEGYLINQFIAQRTNRRTDQWGGSFENRIRFPLRIVERIREQVPRKFIVIFRLSTLDLVEGGSDFEEVVHLAREVEKRGVDIINCGIGWHESRIPTTLTFVPRAAFCWVPRMLKPHVRVPLIASNRLNAPEVAETVLAAGDADLVSLARPLLADAAFVSKSAEGRADDINTCIACNQACLEHTMNHLNATCLVNPVACNETELVSVPASRPRRVVVVGGGPAGLAFAMYASGRGHQVTMYEASNRLGGQFNLAAKVPGKWEFDETIRFYRRQLAANGVRVELNTTVDRTFLETVECDDIVIAAGVVPRVPPIEGMEHPKVVGYADVLTGAPVGKVVAIIGAGGIGFDVAKYLVRDVIPTSTDPVAYMHKWGVDMTGQARGGVEGVAQAFELPSREVHLLQRKPTEVGKGLARTKGWALRAELRNKGVRMVPGCEYLKIDDAGLHIKVDGQPTTIPADTIVNCAGQESANALVRVYPGKTVHVIGGALRAEEIDAKRAIDEACRLALKL